MVTEAQVRRFALAMPDTEERAHFGQPDFRVRGKIFCTIQPKHARSGLKLEVEQLQTLVRMNPEAFRGAPGYERHGWTLVTWAHVTPAQMKRLIEDAYRNVAPKPRSAGAKPAPSSPRRSGKKAASASSRPRGEPRRRKATGRRSSR